MLEIFILLLKQKKLDSRTLRLDFLTSRIFFFNKDSATLLSFHLSHSPHFFILTHFHIYFFSSFYTQNIHIILQLVTEKSPSPARLKTAKTSLSINCMRRFKENSLQFRHSLQILLLLGKALIPVWKDSKDSIMAKLPWQWPQPRKCARI